MQQEQTTCTCSECGQTMPPKPVTVTVTVTVMIPARTYVQIEDDRKAGYLAEGLAEVRLIDEPAEFWLPGAAVPPQVRVCLGTHAVTIYLEESWEES
jgi:hypothetical protein